MIVNRQMYTVLFLLAGLSIVSPVSADTHPVCAYTASDYDGDGWGWENSQSCEVTDESTARPVITNTETGEDVELVRPYWNAYRDFEGRTIQCDAYQYDVRALDYVPYSFFEASSNVAEFLPLQASAPWYGYVRMYYANIDNNFRSYTATRIGLNDALTYWTVNDGIFQTSVPQYRHGLAGARYIELIDDHNGAVRVWQNDNDNAYFDCYDVDGQTFQPTGYMGEPRPSSQTVTDTVVVTVNSPEVSEGIVDRNTNLPVELSAVQWDIAKLYNREFSCTTYLWMDITTWFRGQHEPEYGYTSAISAFHELNAGVSYAINAPDYKTEATASFAAGFYSFIEAAYDVYPASGYDEGRWAVQNSQMTEGPLLDYKYAQKLTDEGAYRFWKSSDNYDECTSLPDGAVNMAGSSTVNPVVPVCIDFDGDGWGWSGTGSCQISTDNTQTTTENTQGCIDTDGDGWGWDGVASCRINNALPATPGSNECIDSDGDGWGWNGVVSCRVDQTQYTPPSITCIDTDGDGWGWDGSASCQLD